MLLHCAHDKSLHAQCILTQVRMTHGNITHTVVYNITYATISDEPTLCGVCVIHCIENDELLYDVETIVCDYFARPANS